MFLELFLLTIRLWGENVFACRWNIVIGWNFASDDDEKRQIVSKILTAEKTRIMTIIMDAANKNFVAKTITE